MTPILHKGDCLNVMEGIKSNSIDAIITDPPYGTTACKWDSVISFSPMWWELNRIIKPNGAIVLFGSEPFSSSLRLSNIRNYKYDWKYKKKIASNFASAKYQPMKHIEDVIVFSKDGKKVNYYPIKQVRAESGKNRIKAGFKYNSEGGADFIGGIERNNTDREYDEDLKFPEDIQEFNNRAKGDRGKHPTQKPVALMEYLIKTYTNENETVLDFTMGSGTTGVACKNLNRKFIGIELDDKYFEIAKQRINNTQLKEELNFDID
jgi:site-specific DNA-methyltransferase (adenine-specific)